MAMRVVAAMSVTTRTVSKVALDDVEHGGDVDVTMWDGASSGLLDESDIEQIAAVIEPGSLAGVLVYENLWSVPLMTALDRSSARMVGNGRIIVEDLLTALGGSSPDEASAGPSGGS